MISPRVLTISDSDSYLKWVVALFETVPAHWRVRHSVLTNVLSPSDAQIAAAGGGWPVARRTLPRLLAEIDALDPDVIVLAATGPAIEAMQEALRLAGRLGHGRAVLMTGLPGISFPANDLAIAHRRHCDLMVLHSHREIGAYADVIARAGGGPQLGLATLPFLRDVRPVVGGEDVVFAAQSLVPAQVAERRQVLAALEDVPAPLHPVVKVRAVAGERQAHNEPHPYAALYEGSRIEFRAGSMARALDHAHGFATVSSTAAIEAIAAGVPSLILGDFGVNAAMINLVFQGSRLIGSLSDLAGARFRTPHAGWMTQNYFHPVTANDWRERLEALVAQRDQLVPIAFTPQGSAAQRARRMARLVRLPRRPGR